MVNKLSEEAYLQETKPLQGGKEIPKDRYHLIYYALILHGFGILIPWNMFITAGPYFMDYKLNVNLTDTDSNEQLSSIRKNFLNIVGSSAQTPNLICSALNLFVSQSPRSLNVRIISSLTIQAILILFNIVLAMIDSSQWPYEFFYITLFSVIIIYSAAGVYQNCIYGLAGKMPMEYSNAAVIGSNLCGTITTIIMIISLATTPDFQTSAIIYFLIALLILLVCLATYFGFKSNPFYRHHALEEDSQSGMIESQPSERPPYLKIFRSIWPQCYNVFLTFFVTLAVFPNVVSQVAPIDNAFGLSSKYFSPLICFLIFNLSAFLGNLLPNLMIWPSPRYLWVPVTARILFVPFFLYCNYIPKIRLWPVIIRSDVFFSVATMFLGLSQGYASSLGMMFACKESPPRYAGIAGMIAAFFLVFGLFCGVNFSFLLTWIVQQNLL